MRRLVPTSPSNYRSCPGGGPRRGGWKPKACAFLALAMVASVAGVLQWPETPTAHACPLQVLDTSGAYRNAYCDSDDNSDNGDDDGGGGGGGGGGSSGPVCWVVWDNGNEDIYAQWFAGEDGEGVDPDEVTFWWNRCLYEDSNMPVGNAPGQPIDTNRDPLDLSYSVPVPLAHEDSWERYLLEEVWQQVEGQLEMPDFELEPAPGRPAIVHIPTFVSVENPQDVIEHEQCSPADAGPGTPVCVGIEAEPNLWFLPFGAGEEPAIECPSEGTAYDPDGPPPETQAEGGCAHAYDTHNADGYPGRVEITWTVSWWVTREGSVDLAGEFDDITLPEGDEPNASRVVEEVQTVITDTEL